MSYLRMLGRYKIKQSRFGLKQMESNTFLFVKYLLIIFKKCLINTIRSAYVQICEEKFELKKSLSDCAF